MSEFLIDINPDKELPKYNLVLYNLNEKAISELNNINGLKLKTYFVGIDELEFNVEKYRNDTNGDIIDNEIYDIIEGDYLIKLNDKQFFIVTQVSEKVDNDGKVFKEIKCLSREYELSHKKLVDYQAESRVLYDNTNSLLDGLEKGILNYIFNKVTKAWTIGYIDPNVLLKNSKEVHRALNFSNSNLLQVFKDLQLTYGCIFKFDTVEQKVNVYAVESSTIQGQHRGFYISDINFINSINKDIKIDDVKTRLYLYGKDNISIQSISPVGQPYIDNFSYYRDTKLPNGEPKYMTQSLINALNVYDTKVINYEPLFPPLLQNLKVANSKLEELYNIDFEKILDENGVESEENRTARLKKIGLIALEREVKNTQILIDVAVGEITIIQKEISEMEKQYPNIIDVDMSSAELKPLKDLYDRKRNKQVLIDLYSLEKDIIEWVYVDGKKTEIENKKIEIQTIEGNLQNLRDELNIFSSSNFTSQQLKELDRFIKVETYNNSDYTEDNVEELLADGKKQLYRISQPNIQFDVDMVDFLNLVEFQHMWDKFILGDIVTLHSDSIGFNYDVRLISYEHDIEGDNLNLKFSNKNSFDDATLYLQELLEDFKTTGTIVDFNKDKWEQLGKIESNISKIIDERLEDARQNILNAIGQRYLFDDSGLWLYKENPDGTIHDSQIRAINDTIALTTDNWKSLKWALDPTGINAEVVRGKLGEFVEVRADQIIVGDNGQKIPSELLDIDIDNTELHNFINITYRDDMNDVYNQIDGKIETWFQTTDPSIYWGAVERNKHNGDMWYNTSTKELKRYNGSTWVLIEDKKAIDAYTKASEAKDTADGKRTVFTSTPYPPYQVGDLWRQNNTVAGFKICVVARTTGSYRSSDWQVTTDIADYIDKNAVKQSFHYNRIKMTEQEGIEVYDNLGRRVLQTGSFDSDGNGTKDMFGHVVYHPDGGYSALVRDGFLRKYQYGEARYLNGIYVWIEEQGGGSSTVKPNDIIVPLDNSYAYRTDVEIVTMPTNFWFFGATGGTINLNSFIDSLSLRMGVTSRNLNQISPFVKVEAYIDVLYLDRSRRYFPVGFYLLVIGK